MYQHGVDSMVLWLSRMDNSGNHKLSLAEIDKAVALQRELGHSAGMQQKYISRK